MKRQRELWTCKDLETDGKPARAQGKRAGKRCTQAGKARPCSRRIT